MSHQHNNHGAAAATHGGHSESHEGGHHGHTIVSMRLLLSVLAILLLFTVLTVSAANAEEFFARTFDVHIPGWVNAVVALSIAAVKSVIVAMYFMQLRYDTNPMNALVAVFTVMVLTFFLGFTAIDLGNRGIIYENKDSQIMAGGYGGISRGSGDRKEDIPAGTSIAVYARQKADRLIEEALNKNEPITNHAYLKRLYISYHELESTPNLEPVKKELAEKMKAYMEHHEAEFEEIAADVNAHSHHGGGHADSGSTANVSRVRTGITPGLMDSPAQGEKPAHEPAKAH